MSELIEKLESGDDIEEVSEVEVSTEEVSAREKGWTDESEWKEAGKEKTDWVTAKHFNERGTWIAEKRKFSETRADFDQRLKDNNKIWQTTLDKQVTELNAKRDDLIELADKDGVKAIDKEIADVNTQKESLKEAPPTKAEVDAENEYFETLDTRPKKAMAAQIGRELSGKGLKGKYLVEAVQEEMDKEFPRVNANRDKPGMTDKSRATPSGGSKSISSIAQLKGQDKDIAQDLINAGLSEKRVLQMINDKDKS
tara:strand:- start:2380 stop:3141 length:762 start_codon:yes stop_codon:yes gene_type:complete